MKSRTSCVQYVLEYFQARQVENLGKVNFEEEIKKRFKMVYVPNWFTVDLKTGVSYWYFFTFG